MSHQRSPSRALSRARLRGRRRGGFTLVELLVVVAILAILLAVLLPAFSMVRAEAKSLLCLNNMRITAVNFRLFADPFAHSNRGDSETRYGNRFSAWDYQESLYEVAEFWNAPSQVSGGKAPYHRGDSPMICSAAESGLNRVSPGTLRTGAVEPPWKVSYAMNQRLLQAPVRLGPFHQFEQVTIGERILDHPWAPLFFDVDARAAYARWGAAGPFYSAPAGETESLYDGTVNDPSPYWFPAFRHRGRIAVSFVGGHAELTEKPLEEAAWDWDYHPPLDR